MIISDEGIFIRQSWLDTAARCAERGRNAIVNPDKDITSDAAVVGTGAHAAIETNLNGGSTAESFAALHAAIDSEAGYLFKTYTTDSEVRAFSESCFRGWQKSILPELQNAGKVGARTEVKFSAPLFKLADGRQVGLQGTVDYPLDSPFNEIIDWKSSARKYKQRDKQQHATQPTTYAWAAVLGALGSDHYRWPMTFTYGVMIRPSDPHKDAVCEMIPVHRTENHARWQLNQIQTFLNMYFKMGLDTPWPTTTEGNWLCSRRWCAYFDTCRGGFLTPTDDALVALS